MSQILGVEIPSLGNFTAGASGVFTNILYVFLFIIFVIVVLGLCWWFGIEQRKYKYKIEIYENLGGTRYVKTGVDRAKVVRMGDGGEEILWLKKHKMYKGAYGRKMGTNLIWFAIGQDGYWYNITLGDLDAKQGMLDIEPIDRDMRYAHVAIRRNLKDRYNKPKWMEKYGTMLMGLLFLIVMGALLWFLIDKMADSATTLANAAQTNAEVQKGINQALTSLDNILSKSGTIKA